MMRARLARLALCTLAWPAALTAQQHAGAGAHPFFVGERLEFAAKVPKVGAKGTGTMWVEGPVEIRGRQTLHLRFDFSARKGPLTAEDRSASWLDPARMAALRFSKRERHPLSSNDERVEIFPDERRWAAGDGAKGTSPTDQPLDELSFMYFLRTLPLDADTLLRLDRHFDPARSPTTVKVVGREAITTPAGTFDGIVVEMRVRDARRYRGEGVIRVTLSDDACRLPLRLESRMPVVGRAVLTLVAHNHAGAAHAAGHAPHAAAPHLAVGNLPTRPARTADGSARVVPTRPGTRDR